MGSDDANDLVQKEYSKNKRRKEEKRRKAPGAKPLPADASEMGRCGIYLALPADCHTTFIDIYAV